MTGKFCKYHFSSANPLSFAYIFLLKAKNEENFVNLLPALQTTDTQKVKLPLVCRESERK
jgi:hypothetical protein